MERIKSKDKRYARYVQYPYERKPITIHKSKSFPKKKVRNCDIPRDYRKYTKENVKKSIIYFVQMLLICIFFTSMLAFFFIVFN